MDRFFQSLCFLFILIQLSNAQEFDVLVFSKTAGFRHASIEAGQAAIQVLGGENDFSVTLSENSDDFTLENLSQYETVIFLSTTGDILSNEQQSAFETYISQGGGFVGIHAASDTEYTWEWYGNLVGAYFNSHPSIQQAVIEVADRVHPSTSFLEDYWERTDEWYNYQGNPRGKVHVLATLDESSYNGGNMGHDHPIAWCHEFEGGRSWYTGGGHTSESFAEPLFLQHILGGIFYASGRIKGDFTATMSEKFEMEILDNDPLSPMAISVLPSLDVLYIERGGTVKLRKVETGQISVAGTLDVDSGREDGLIGITIDPNFKENNWVYLFYSPTGENKQNVSRFEFMDGSLIMESEIIILEIPVQRSQCCHSGGDLEFDEQGNLWIATGDNVNPFQSNGFAPIDERDGRSAFDAQGTSANTKDLRGKILRIHPEDDGSYGIPDGNLFSDENEGLPEIYVMGTRNPFRIAVNASGELVWGDVGPDASSDVANRGPRGYDEVNRTKVPGNFGWPYAVADNKAYHDYDFSNNSSGAEFDLQNLVNDSPDNTGANNLPPAIPAWLYYHNGNNPDRPEFNGAGGRSILGGVFYKYDADNGDTLGLPRYFDDVLIVGDWSRNWIKEVRVDENGDLHQINPLLPHLDLKSPIDIEIGPDGNLYIVEWGTGFSSDNADARVIKVSYRSTAGNSAPIASIKADKTSGQPPLEVNFDGSDSRDLDIGDMLTYSWDFDDDGNEDSDQVSPSFIYEDHGIFNATLTVTDQEELRAVDQVQIVVGNTAPSVNIEYPADGSFFAVGDTIPYSVRTADAEDPDECGENLPLGINIEPSIGHDDHSHGEGGDDACEGFFITSPHGDESDDLFYVLNAQYTDRGGEVNFPLTDRTFHILQPKMKQAQHALEYFDLRTEVTGDFLGGGLNMAYINDHSHLKYGPMNFKDIEYVTVRWAALNKDSRVELHIDSPTGPIIAQRSLPITGAWQTYDYFTMELEDPGGSHDLYVVFRKPGQSSLGNLNFMEFHGRGAATIDHQEGKGLTATYYEHDDFTGASVTRNEPMIAWDWDMDSPVEGIPEDQFSVRWEGGIEAPTSGDYKLSAQTTSGSYTIMIDGQLVNESEFNFTAGQFYDIEVEYIHTTGDASISLRWEGPNPVNVIHTEFLRTKEIESGVDGSDVLRLNVYPTVFNDQINIEGNFVQENYELLSIDGQLVSSGLTDGIIQTANIIPGVYILKIRDTQTKVIKHE